MALWQFREGLVMMCPTLYFSADDFELLAEKCAELLSWRRLFRSSSAPGPTQPSAAAATTDPLRYDDIGDKTVNYVDFAADLDPARNDVFQTTRQFGVSTQARAFLASHPVALAVPGQPHAQRGARAARGRASCSGGRSPAPRGAAVVRHATHTGRAGRSVASRGHSQTGRKGLTGILVSTP